MCAAYAPDDLLRSERVPDVAAGRWVAGAWRRALLDKGGFEKWA